jgi:hypothetical protein
MAQRRIADHTFGLQELLQDHSTVEDSNRINLDTGKI